MWWRQHLQFGGRSFRQRRFGSEKRSSHHNSKIFTNNARIKESPNIFTNNARIKANIITINPRIRLASKYRATQATTETVRTIITGPECYIHLWAVACSGLWILGANSYESLSLDALTIPPSLSFINFLGIYVVPHRHDFKPRPPHPLPLFFPLLLVFLLRMGSVERWGICQGVCPVTEMRLRLHQKVCTDLSLACPHILFAILLHIISKKCQ